MPLLQVGLKLFTTHSDKCLCVIVPEGPKGELWKSTAGIFVFLAGGIFGYHNGGERLCYWHLVG